MIIEDMEQGSEEWFKARLGIPTASNFDQIVTTQGKASTQSKGYMLKLIAETLTGQATGMQKTEWMERGNELEAEARKLFEFENDVEVEQVGIVYKDNRKQSACSPDGLVFKNDFPVVGVEIKCPAPHTHVGYLLDNKLPTKYIMQVQGSMWVTGLDEWVFMSYHPDIAPLIITVKRDESIMESLDKYIPKFVSDMEIAEEHLFERGIAA